MAGMGGGSAALVPPELDADLQMLTWMLPDQDPRMLASMLMQQYRRGDSGGSTGGINTVRLNELLMGLMEGSVPDTRSHSGPVPRSGYARKEEVVFEPLDMDEEVLYDWKWKSLNDADESVSKNAPKDAPLQQQLAQDVDGGIDDTDAERDMRFMQLHNDSWIEPIGERAKWIAGGQYLPSTEGRAPPPEDGLDSGYTNPPNEDVAHWTQDWEEDSDDGELLDARVRLGTYSDAFEDNQCMRVSKELRKNPELFEREKEEVLSRVLTALRKTLLDHKPAAPEGSPTRRQPDNEGDPTPMVLFSPFVRALELCCCRVLCALDTPVVLTHAALDNPANRWTLPDDEPNATHFDVRDVAFEVAPVSWQCRTDSCCCLPCGPCYCADTAVTAVKGVADVTSLLDLYLHPSMDHPPTVYDLDVKVRRLDIGTFGGIGCCSCDPDAASDMEIKLDNGNCEGCRKSVCKSWHCSVPRCCYGCLATCCNPCMRCALRRELAKSVPQMLPEPPPQKHMM